MGESTSGQVNQLLVDRVNKRQSNMVSRRVNEWTSGQVNKLLAKSKLRPVSPMKGEIIGDRCQTCQKDEINNHSFEF